jgi:hypothetical protein
VKTTKTRGASIRWPLMIIALFASNVAICAYTVYSAVSDDSFAVEPDYYQKALHWDTSRIARVESAGLSVESAVSGDQLIVVVLRHGQPLADADVSAEWFHRSRAADRSTVTFTSNGAGAFSSVVPFTRIGLHELRIRVESGDTVVGCTHTLEYQGVLDPSRIAPEPRDG